VVGLFGAFDTGDLGEVALRRVIERELGRRRPDLDVVAMAPFGAERPIPGDEGRPARALPSIAAGPGLGGILVSLLGAANVVLAQAITFLRAAAPEPADRLMTALGQQQSPPERSHHG